MSRLPPDHLYFLTLFCSDDSYIEIERISLELINRNICDNLRRLFSFNSNSISRPKSSIFLTTITNYLQFVFAHIHRRIHTFHTFVRISKRLYSVCTRVKPGRGIGVKLFQRGGSLVDETASFPGDWRLVAVSLKGDNDEATRKGFRKGLRKSTFPPSRRAFRSW